MTKPRADLIGPRLKYGHFRSWIALHGGTRDCDGRRCKFIGPLMKGGRFISSAGYGTGTTRPIRNYILSGQTFGRLTIVRREDKFDRDGKRRRSYLCDCACGMQKVIQAGRLLRGVTRSCGCLSREVCCARNQKSVKHGLCGSREYRRVSSIIDRCTNPHMHAFSAYGGRGITVYEKWLRDRAAFVNYIVSVLGPCPSVEHSLDRIDNDKGYEPGNLRWATRKEQAANRRKVASLEQFSTAELLQELDKRKINAAA